MRFSVVLVLVCIFVREYLRKPHQVLLKFQWKNKLYMTLRILILNGKLLPGFWWRRNSKSANNYSLSLVFVMFSSFFFWLECSWNFSKTLICYKYLCMIIKCKKVQPILYQCSQKLDSIFLQNTSGGCFWN